MRKLWLGLSFGILVLGLLGTARADLIDFESGFSDQDPVSSITTPTNTVSFYVVDAQGHQKSAYIAKVGDPTTAFVPHDTPTDTGISGNYFLTDEKKGFISPIYRSSYYMSFKNPVDTLSLNLYDYRTLWDGGPHFGSTATLYVYDQSGNVVGYDTYTVPFLSPNGNIASLLIGDPSAPIYSAALLFSTGDMGTGIDNINFTTDPPHVPLPSTLVLMGTGLLGILGLGWRKKQQ